MNDRYHKIRANKFGVTLCAKSGRLMLKFCDVDLTKKEAIKFNVVWLEHK